MQHVQPTLSGERLNKLHDKLLELALAQRQYLLEAFYASGYPPGAQPVPAAQEYQNLVELRDAQDPRFLDNPQAQHRLDVLARRFGPPPPFFNPQQVAQQAAALTPVTLPPGGVPAQIPNLLTEMVQRHSLAQTIHGHLEGTV